LGRLARLQLARGSDELKIDFGTIEAESNKVGVNHIRQKLPEGYGLWTDVELEETKYLTAEWKAQIERLKYADGLRSDVPKPRRP
jgi:hypothetical protein